MAELDARRAEILSSAAKTIQRRIRTHIARKRFVALRKATIVVQSICRGEPSEKLLWYKLVLQQQAMLFLGDFIAPIMEKYSYMLWLFTCRKTGFQTF